MPEYLAPGVYVEEVSFRSKSIEGVSTTTTGFVGPARYGPIDLPPDVVTSLVEYERTYGDRQQLQFDGSSPTHNYMWHAVRAFFENGGKRLYIARTFERGATDGIAKTTIANGTETMTVSARFPGAAGNVRVRITLTLGSNVLAGNPGDPAPVLRGVLENDVVLVTRRLAASPPSSPLSQPEGTFAKVTVDRSTSPPAWRFQPESGTTIDLSSLHANPDPSLSDSVQVVTAAFTIFPVDSGQPSLVYSGLALDRAHERAGSRDSIWAQFRPDPPSLAAARNVPIVVAITAGTDTGLRILNLLAPAGSPLQTRLLDPKTSDADRSIDLALTGGNDGKRPTATVYEGTGGDPDARTKTGLVAFEDLDEISIVAAPGSSFGYENGYRSQASTIFSLLISHCMRMRYRIAVLDAGDKQSIAEVRALRAKLDSTYAALYYPWVTVLDPVTQQEIHVPPSGAVCGIYARNDINRGVYKAPANEVVETAIGLETLLNKSQQDILNPLGINCFRFFEGRGYRLWGARTISSDPEWKYVNLRRYFAYLEHSIDKGTQWAVFEPNGDLLWANVRRTIEDFLLNEWQNGALLGDKPEKAYFVKCDRSTMTQNDLDNGRLVCLVGVAALRPAEYVIIRIGQWTADRKV
ncbi:MAG TPA: phage tail sheath subtilisin-like domain-containing protein [Thermoanaerobaculia bacterium]|nr:phage tail sheath subtilisin-like domain-containing protein [Thermoanaerobaculia bacterium]